LVFFITGASGSGKTACFEPLSARHPNIHWYDFDERGVPPDADTAWRQGQTEAWLITALEHQAAGEDTAICGGAIPGEIIACPSRSKIDGISICLLDCDDVVRIDRIRASGQNWDTMDTLCWAAWQRMHAVDPEWRPDIIRDNGAKSMHWERWADWKRGDPRWPKVWRLDTTNLSIDEVVAKLSQWITLVCPGFAGSPPRSGECL
jgi:hypothetical protein